jgi:uncharacterized protein YndB with AHSA1/START domain
MSTQRHHEAVIEADPTVPIIRITRDFAAAPAQLLEAHLDPALFVRWVGPDGMDSRVIDWEARDGGSWRYVAEREDLGDGRTRLHAQSLVDSFAGRDAWLASGMEVGVNEGYAKLDALLAGGAGS